MEKLDVGVRPMREGDLHFVVASWINSFQRSSEFGRYMVRSLYRKCHRTVVMNILARPATRVYIAHDPQCDDVIYGFLVVEMGMDRPIVHYAFTKEVFRRFGVFNKLAETSGIDMRRVYYSHFTKDRPDLDEKSETYGQLRYRGAETLLQKYPPAREEWDPKTKRLKFTDGTLYCPYFMA